MSLLTRAQVAPYTVHDEVPSGFSYGDAVQSSLFADTGSVPGASKVALLKGEHWAPGDDYPHVHLLVRLRPPTEIAHLAHTLYIRRLQGASVEDYVRQYNNGWQASRRNGGDSSAWDSGNTSAAWDDGYLDAAAERPKWHLAYCVDHDNCGVG